jgi:hypothetical protein
MLTEKEMRDKIKEFLDASENTMDGARDLCILLEHRHSSDLIGETNDARIKVTLLILEYASSLRILAGVYHSVLSGTVKGELKDAKTSFLILDIVHTFMDFCIFKRHEYEEKLSLMASLKRPLDS